MNLRSIVPDRKPRCPRSIRLAFLLPGALVFSAALADVQLAEGTNISADASASEERLVIDLLGGLWTLPLRGGAAERIGDNLQPAARPKWSPDGGAILYQATSPSGSGLRILDLANGESAALSHGSDFDQHPDWHPGGGRIVFSSARGDGDFDLWERHLDTGLTWRISDIAGDETEPAWSADGRDLAYIHRLGEQWRLVLRRQGQPEQTLFVSGEPLAAPSWRPDGSLITFLRRANGGYRLEMVILSNPPLVRTLADNEDFFLSPVSWLDRMRFVYTADGVVKQRGFNGWVSEEVPFRATLPEPGGRFAAPSAGDELAVTSPSGERLVVRAARLFDGETPGYRQAVDVVIEQGRIVAVEPRRDWPDATVLDLGDSTILPGYIDTYASLPEGRLEEVGLALLSYGVTTVVADAPAGFDPLRWEGEDSPGPRLLRAAALGSNEDDDSAARLSLLTVPSSAVGSVGAAAFSGSSARLPLLAESWSTGLSLEADLLLGPETLPASPRGRRYQDLDFADGGGSPVLVSGLADASTPGLAALLQSRQARSLRHGPTDQAALPRRFSVLPDLSRARAVVIGSRPSGLPAGPGSHAEMLALAAAGLSGEDVLNAAGRNAGAALGLEGQIGRVAPGALADLVLVAGDPRQRIADALNIVAVVRNGRFYSLVRLLEEAAERSVE